MSPRAKSARMRRSDPKRRAEAAHDDDALAEFEDMMTAEEREVWPSDHVVLPSYSVNRLCR